MKTRFRVWDGYKMWYPNEIGVLWFLSSDGTVCSFMSDKNSDILGEGFLNTNKKAVAMLSTGLKDKDGEEIFVDDILEDVVGDGGKYRVEAFAGAGLPYNYLIGETLAGAENHSKSIGNKYENPELLEEVA